MEHLPFYISIIFIITTLITLWLFYKAADYSKSVIIIIALWLLLQSVISLSGFYTVVTGIPPRFVLLLMPPIAFIIILFFIKKGKEVIDSFDVKTLTLLQIVRVLVEVILYLLFVNKVIPQVMTFEGRNFDILCGLTAPFVYYFGYIKNVITKGVLIAWNIVCLLLLANIVITTLLSAPFPIQKFGFDQPDFALFYFPFIFLPGFIVPAVLFAHLTAIRRLVKPTSPLPIA